MTTPTTPNLNGSNNASPVPSVDDTAARVREPTPIRVDFEVPSAEGKVPVVSATDAQLKAVARAVLAALD